MACVKNALIAAAEQLAAARGIAWEEAQDLILSGAVAIDLT